MRGSMGQNAAMQSARFGTGRRDVRWNVRFAVTTRAHHCIQALASLFESMFEVILVAVLLSAFMLIWPSEKLSLRPHREAGMIKRLVRSPDHPLATA
ncbi:hypothetical protein JOF56_003757 [Kibdelosporangium banguiense]|uniref:Uncharacterized protein n=1 Tax=Kibdelosporangium banguiense TaxID=1365924 RepID=A0ABS4TG22_9PSEU|nr:hypothetical protein [Kibdelosporangium banguiense]